MQIVLLRHGATDWNLQGRCQGSSDRRLTEVGLRQAEQIAIQLGNETIHAIYSSSLERARQTAALVSRPHNLPVMIEDDVRELDHGQLEGLTFNEIKAKYSDFLTIWRTAPAELQIPGGERLADVAERAWRALSRIAQRHQTDQTVVVVSHNFPILGVVCRVTGTDLNNYRSFHLDPCGVTRITQHRNGLWEVTHVNSKPYTLPRP
ncbi:MAG TPA: histidine phosphatase family protein [Candidatus Binatia bacterium]